MNQVVLDNQVISLVATTTDGWSGFFTPDSRLHPQPGGFCKLLGEWHAISQPLGFPGRSMVRCLVFSSLTWQEGTPHDLPIFE